LAVEGARRVARVLRESVLVPEGHGRVAMAEELHDGSATGRRPSWDGLRRRAAGHGTRSSRSPPARTSAAPPVDEGADDRGGRAV